MRKLKECDELIKMNKMDSTEESQPIVIPSMISLLNLIMIIIQNNNSSQQMMFLYKNTANPYQI
jgi:hypothetical protein